MSASATEIVLRLAEIRDRIASAGGDPDRVRIVAVTKGFGPDAAIGAVAAGITDLGENYAQEMMGKWRDLDSWRRPRADHLGAASPRWHFLGSIQRNKVKQMAQGVDCWQGVARSVEGADIAKYRPGASVFIQVLPEATAGRKGCSASEVPQLNDHLVGLGLDVRGLMVVAPRQSDDARRAFVMLRQLAERLGLSELSMGMSDDLEIAVQEGSTMVRVGRALFGPRAGQANQNPTP